MQKITPYTQCPAALCMSERMNAGDAEDSEDRHAVNFKALNHHQVVGIVSSPL
jgi:hypothetical protein